MVRPEATVDEVVLATSENRVHRVLVGERRSRLPSRWLLAILAICVCGKSSSDQLSLPDGTPYLVIDTFQAERIGTVIAEETP